MFGKDFIFELMTDNSRSELSTVKVLSTFTRLGSVPVKEIVARAGDALDTTVVPDNIYHASVLVHGKVYDYILGKGIIIWNKNDFVKNNFPLWTSSKFKTDKTEGEFSRWVEEQKVKNFTPTNYDMADNNCLTFVKKATEFLGGDPGERLEKQRQFALNNRHWARIRQLFS